MAARLTGQLPAGSSGKRVIYNNCHYPTYMWLFDTVNGEGAIVNGDAPDQGLTIKDVNSGILDLAHYSTDKFGFAENATVQTSQYAGSDDYAMEMYLSLNEPFGPTGWDISIGSYAEANCTDGSTQVWTYNSTQGRAAKNVLECVGAGNKLGPVIWQTAVGLCIQAEDFGYDKDHVLRFKGTALNTNA